MSRISGGTCLGNGSTKIASHDLRSQARSSARAPVECKPTKPTMNSSNAIAGSFEILFARMDEKRNVGNVPIDVELGEQALPALSR